MNPCIFIFGFGYTAHFLARQLATLNFTIKGTSRKKESLGYNSQFGYELVDFTEASIEQHLCSATHILISTPPSVSGDPVLANYSDLLKKYAHQIQWIGYLSSTGVYGDHHGRWVDESSMPIRLETQGQLRLNAENDWVSLAQHHNLPLHVFRLAGIYGPKRNALTRLTAGKIEWLL